MNKNKNASAPNALEAINTLLEYKRERRELEVRLEREREIWKSVYNNSNGSASWIFNSIVNKHADIIDSIPTCICLPREEKDEKDAEMLSKIIPVICERSEFDACYSDNAWEKLKYGVAIYGVFWNNFKERGLGDIDIKQIKLENIYWENGVSDIQDSKNLFITALCDVEMLEAAYPHFKYKEHREDEQKLLSALTHSSSIDGKCLVVDWYYKKFDKNGSPILHYCKLVGSCVLYSSEQDDDMTGGWYEHGQYPVVVDIMYPEEDSAVGFGLISIAEDAQNYVNRIDDNILGYSDWASRVRFWAKRSLGVNEKDFLDLEKRIVEVEGDIDEEKLKQIEIGTLDSSVIDVKKMKIEEIKELTGSRDVSQGGITGGVTAASAISILKESGAKSSRDGIAQSYRAYVKIIILVIELIRQFYDYPRIFRILGDSGEREYLSFSANRIRGDGSKKPYFDIEVSAITKSPTESKQKNEFAKDLYEKGAFKVQNAEETLMMLELMDFDGIEKLKATLRKTLQTEKRS